MYRNITVLWTVSTTGATKYEEVSQQIKSSLIFWNTRPVFELYKNLFKFCKIIYKLFLRISNNYTNAHPVQIRYT